MNSTNTYLIDMQGKLVHGLGGRIQTRSPHCLLENGHLFATGLLPSTAGLQGLGTGAGCRNSAGKAILPGTSLSPRKSSFPHHDFARLPNGNVLLIVWDGKGRKEVLAAGRRQDKVANFVLLDCLIEIKPTGPTTGDIVWEWHLWDHLIQDHDKLKSNYGNVADHPELADFNFGENAVGMMASTKQGMDKLRSIGYVGSNTAEKQTGMNPEWSHFNGVAYNPDLDQIMISVLTFSEFWIIDHSTTTAGAQPCGRPLGKRRRSPLSLGESSRLRAGAGRPTAIRPAQLRTGFPQDCQCGHVLVFNNGSSRPQGSYSSVEELALPVDKNGRYDRTPGAAFGPDRPIWTFTNPRNRASIPCSFPGQRLPNGDTFICSGGDGTMFEVTPEKGVVWKYVNPVRGWAKPVGPKPDVSKTGNVVPLSGTRSSAPIATVRTIPVSLARI